MENYWHIRQYVVHGTYDITDHTLLILQVSVVGSRVYEETV